jgi:ShK domain-like
MISPLLISVRSKEYMGKHCPASCESVQQQKQETRQTQEDEGSISSGECIDKHPHCPQWAALGECTANIDVRNHCSKSCLGCDSSCADSHINCKFWADAGECEVSTTIQDA